VATEEKFTKFDNKVLDALIQYRIPGQEMKCILFIIRKTWGFHKITDNIALSQFRKATGMDKSSISKALDRLRLKKVIIVGQNANKKGKDYRINKKFQTWEKQGKRTKGKTLVKLPTNVGKMVNETLVKAPTTKERKENNKRKQTHFLVGGSTRKRFAKKSPEQQLKELREYLVSTEQDTTDIDNKLDEMMMSKKCGMS